MISFDLFLFIIFISHGFCDLVPLLTKSKKKNILLYISLIFINICIHSISADISTILFVILSSIHFSGDFYPRNKPNILGPGYLILGIPAVLDIQNYIYYLKYLDIKYYYIFLTFLYFINILYLLKILKYSSNAQFIYFIIFYSILAWVYGVNVIYYYMLLYHLPISLLELTKIYKFRLVFLSMITGFMCIGCLVGFILTLFTQEKILIFLQTNKNIIHGSVFGLLNSHSLTTMTWRLTEN